MVKGFPGYVRPDGKVGVRNFTAIVGLEGLTIPVVRRVATWVPQVVAFTVPTGRGQVGNDYRTTLAAVRGIAANPNVANVLLVAYDRSFIEPLLDSLHASVKPFEVLAVGEFGSTLDASAVGARLAADQLIEASGQTRESVPISRLTVALKCGLSDSTSGIAANRVLGTVVDRLIDEGATVVFGETAELAGAEDMLARRARNADLAASVRALVGRRATLPREMDGTLAEGVLGPENRRGGLTTVEEKALGNVIKTGQRPIDGLLEYADAPHGAGLWMMDTPIFASEAVTAMVAGGCTIVAFTTGFGNPYGHPIAPTIKIGGNPKAHPKARSHLDADVSGVLTGDLTLPSAADAVYRTLVNVASGRLTQAEALSEDGYAIAREGPSA